MISRRRFTTSLLKSSGLIALAPSLCLANRKPNSETLWRMPDESEPHKRTWMAFGAQRDIWGSDLLYPVFKDLAKIATHISDYEPVSMLVREEEFEVAYRLMGPSVDLIASPMDDLWIRDTGPVFVTTDRGRKAAIDFNFNGWGEKQAFSKDANIASRIAEAAQIPKQPTQLILEGGAIEVDGQGTAIITESCVLNSNRNPGLSRRECEAELKALLGLEKVIWLPGIKGKDITDGHTDFYARFTAPGVVVANYDPDPTSFDHAVTLKHLEILRQSEDALGRKLKVIVLETPRNIRDEYNSENFAAGYINFYTCNGAVIMPEFGDKVADENARSKLQEQFPERDIVALNIDAIAAGGGGIHCATLQEPV